MAPLFRTSFLLRAAGLLAALLLPACVVQPAPGGQAADAGPPASHGAKVGLLLPLTGPAASVGQALLNAAQLTLAQPGAPELLTQDTLGTPEGAATAARQAIDGGAGILLGPLTAPETTAAAPAARAAGVPMLAFTSDVTLAQPGVWTLGLAPAQQVRRLLPALKADGRARIAAVLPQNIFGDALATALQAAAAEQALPEPRIVRTPGTAAGFLDGLKTLAATTPPADPAIPSPPPPFDALLLGATGDVLPAIVPQLATSGFTPPQVRIVGPATWLREAPRLPALAGAWFAALDPAARTEFDRRYAAKYGAPPRDFASIAYDAAGIARVIATPAGFPAGSLARPQGFVGADGLIALRPDGQVRRGLAVFEVDRGSTHIVQPAPTSASAPGS